MTITIEDVKAWRINHWVDNRDTQEIEQVEIALEVYPGEEWGAIAVISGEDGSGLIDYYGEFRCGYRWIHPEIERLAAEAGVQLEWIDPGTVGVYAD